MRRRQPFAEGDDAVIIDTASGRQYFIQLAAGRTFQTHRSGYFRHEQLFGRPDGSIIATDRGRHIIALRPTLEGHLLNLTRQTQILYPKDLGLILLKGDIFPGAKVLEAGIGSGALSTTLLRFLGPEGHLISYEIRESFARLAQNNTARARRLYGDGGGRHTVRDHDIYTGIVDHDLDTVILDVPEPVRCIEHAVEALRPGGVLLTWVPTTLQVYDFVRALQESGLFAAVETVEVLMRPWDVGARTIRPAHRMVAHTGFLISGRRLARPGDDGGEPRTGAGSD